MSLILNYLSIYQNKVLFMVLGKAIEFKIIMDERATVTFPKERINFTILGPKRNFQINVFYQIWIIKK